MKTIEINGVQYQKIEEEEKSTRKSTRKLNSYLLHLAAIASVTIPGQHGGAGKGKRPVIELEKEFELIQNKKSTLSKANRDWVERTFNNYYKKISK